MKKRKKPFILIAIVVILLSVVGYVNMKSAFGKSANPDEQPSADAPPPLQTGTEQRDDMKQALKATMSGTNKMSISPEGGGPVKAPQRPLVENPEVPPSKPVPSDSQTGRLSDKPEARH